MIAALAVLLLQCPDGSPPPCAARASRAAAAPTSVAVLYFDNLSRDTSDAYVADGLTEELITRLGQIERLQVKSRTAVQRYRGRQVEDPAVLGRTLGVAHLVSGSVRRGGGRLRVTVEMTRAATGVRVWGESYERRSEDLMSVEADIARAIAEGIGGQLAPSERRSLTSQVTGNPAAYDRLLRGNYALSRRTGLDVRRAIAEYEAAVRLDPALSRAWARIGLAYYLFLDWQWPWPGLPRDSLLARGFTAADRALALDSTASDGWMARGLLLTYRDPLAFSGVVPSMERAVQLDPRNAEAWHQLGGVLTYYMDNVAALRAFDRALELDPQRMITLSNYSLVLRYLRRYAEAVRMADSAVAVNPDAYYTWLLRGWAHLDVRNVPRARADLDMVLRLRPADGVWDTDALHVAVLAGEGDSATARDRATEMAQRVSGNRPLTYQEAASVALALTAAGLRDQAIGVLERAQSAGIFLWWWMQDPLMDPLRSDPRFQRLLDSLRPPAR